MKQTIPVNKTFSSSFSSLSKEQNIFNETKTRQSKLGLKFKSLLHQKNTFRKTIKNNTYRLNSIQSIQKNIQQEYNDKELQTNIQKHQYYTHRTNKVTLHQQKQKREDNFQFFTLKDLLQKNIQNSSYKKKITTICNKQHQKKDKLNIDYIEQPQQSQLQKNKQTQTIQQKKQQQKYQNKQLVTYLDTQASCYSLLWQKFIKSLKNIQNNQQMLCLAQVCQQDRNKKLLTQSMKQMQFLLDQHEIKIQDIAQKLSQINDVQIKKYYFQSHQLHEKHMSAKNAICEHKIQFNQYLQRLKQQEKEKKQMLQSKRQTSNKKSQQTSINNSPLRYLHNELNMSDKDIKLVMEKKSKLNLELDLSFQIQQRRKIAKQKQQFQQKKLKLQKEKLSIECRIKEIKQKTQFKEREIQRYQFQIHKLKRQRQYFLKMLLKNPQYRLDGILWVFRKMIQFGHEPQISDFSADLDNNAKTFLIHEFYLIKQQQIFKPRTIIKRRKKIFNKDKGIKNRQRVKSVTAFKSQQDWNMNGNDLNSNNPPKQDKGFFTFGSKNLKPMENKIRKKSGSMILLKNYEQSIGQTQQHQSRFQTKNNSFKTIIKQNNQKKIYESTKKYLKNWINKGGWNSYTPRAIDKVNEQMIPQKFISDQKIRAKHKYFKIGRSNTRYNSIVKTLYGSQQDVSKLNRRVKTSRS